MFRVTCAGEPVADPAEIAAYEWAESADLAVRTDLSPWCVVQLTELSELGPRPRGSGRLPIPIGSLPLRNWGPLSRLTARAYKP
ncbi:MAG TPA: hypothetical protein VGD15_04015 [Kribbella sp.]